MANRCFIKLNGQWVSLSPMIKRNGQWERCPVYIKENGVWNRIDQQLVTKTYKVSGYCDWNACYVGTSSSDSSLHKNSDPYKIRQGKYSTYYYYSPISFKSIFDKVRGKNITKVTVELKNDHSYYSTGLNMYLSGMTSSINYEPSSITTSYFNSKKYSSNVFFSKGGTQIISLNSEAINDIKNNVLHGVTPKAVAGWSLNDYGYYSGSGSTRPYVEITYTEQVWE